jgi:hypothetical protein
VNPDHGCREYLAWALVLSILGMPAVLSGHSSIESNMMSDCNADEVSMVVRINHGDHLHVLEDEWMGNPPLSYLRYSAFGERSSTIPSVESSE